MSCLRVEGGFQWDEPQPNRSSAPESDDDTSEEEEATTSLPRKRKAVELEEDSTLNFSKIGKFDASSPIFEELETIDECERLVLAYPNSSKAWLLYMVFHLKQAEIEKAKNVAQKSLKSISFREEKERLNIWISLLNIEILYGTGETLDQTFRKALSCNEQKPIYSHMIELYIKYEKMEEAETLFQVMIQKFKQDKDVWVRFITFYMQIGKAQHAHKLMARSFQCLPKKLHVDITAKLAHLEYKHGDAEKGRSMFENIIQNTTKRQDLLTMYINLLRKHGDDKHANYLAEQLKK